MFLQEKLKITAETGAYQTVESAIVAAAQWLKLGVEAVGALVIAAGVVMAIYQLVAHFSDEQPSNFNRVRLTLGKYLTLALEFQVGADILSTAIAPSWEQIGKLAAVAAIRTLLNYFLTKELIEEQKREQQSEIDKNEI
ncbi:MAG: DUF1622 domain-containing protein [Pyrinomonadaceae bacterium]|nr:DUF1622 domain-containing protein [Pyrinomonadaceae bacterium]